MVSIAFPKMFTKTKTLLNGDSHSATRTNLMLLLGSEKGELFGDPYFGTRVRRFLFEKNNSILRDVVIDEIYTAIKIFMPQLILSRKDIELESDGTSVTVTIKCTNRLDYITDMFSINLISTMEEVRK